MRLLVILLVAVGCSSPSVKPAAPSTSGSAAPISVEANPTIAPSDTSSAGSAAEPPRTGSATQPAATTPAATTPPATPPAPAPKTCAAKVNPKGCPETQPNVNASCNKKGLECSYGVDCCRPVFVCTKFGRFLTFEAQFRGCETPG